MERMHGTRWTKHEDRTLRTMRVIGEPQALIRERLYWRTIGGIQGRTRRLRLVPGKPAETPWSKPQDDALADCRKRGLSASETAEELTRLGIRKTTRDAVLGRINRTRRAAGEKQ